MRQVLDLMPNAEISEDEDGQLCINTGLKEETDAEDNLWVREMDEEENEILSHAIQAEILSHVIQVANNAYGDDLVAQYHEDPDGEFGDTLAKFIVRELVDAVEGETTHGGFIAGINRMERAGDQLMDVAESLKTALNEQPGKIPRHLAVWAESEKSEGALDDLVHNTASEIGSSVNNEGTLEQIKFLQEQGISWRQIEKAAGTDFDEGANR